MSDEDRSMAAADLDEIVEPGAHECEHRQPRIVVFRRGRQRRECVDKDERAVIVPGRELDRDAAAERLSEEHDPIRGHARLLNEPPVRRFSGGVATRLGRLPAAPAVSGVIE